MPSLCIAVALVLVASVCGAQERPAGLKGLYAGSIGLQAFDAYSTLTALNHGARDVNPVMRNLPQDPIAFVLVKSAATSLTIVAAERLWKEGHRKSAVVAMVATNSLMAWVAVNNARHLR